MSQQKIYHVEIRWGRIVGNTTHESTELDFEDKFGFHECSLNDLPKENGCWHFEHGAFHIVCSEDIQALAATIEDAIAYVNEVLAA